MCARCVAAVQRLAQQSGKRQRHAVTPQGVVMLLMFDSYKKLCPFRSCLFGRSQQHTGKHVLPMPILFHPLVCCF